MSLPSEYSSLVDFRPGDRFVDRYTFERVVGTGAMGVVVAARHDQLRRLVAIKILTVPTDLHPDAVDRFLSEARASASLRSEHIARMMDAGTDERGRHFIVMEYLEGQDLAAVLRGGGPVAVTQAVGYLLQTCEALAEAHTQGIVHRDLKPENIFLTSRADGSPLIKVLDFGISKMVDAKCGEGSLSPSTPASLFGTPLYMSPEQIRTPSNVDPRSDVWALGVILFELLTGRRPFAGQSLLEIFASVLVDTPPFELNWRPDLPLPLLEIIGRCLEKDVDKRMPSVGELARSLHEWAPRWARDSAHRAARLAGVPTPETQSIKLIRPLPAVVTGPGASEIRHSAKATLGPALITAGIACVLFAVATFLIHQAGAVMVTDSPATTPAKSRTDRWPSTPRHAPRPFTALSPAAPKDTGTAATSDCQTSVAPASVMSARNPAAATDNRAQRGWKVRRRSPGRRTGTLVHSRSAIAPKAPHDAAVTQTAKPSMAAHPFPADLLDGRK